MGVYFKFAGAKSNLITIFMTKSDTQPNRATLEKREVEVQRLIRQMKSDQLHNSPVYQKLQQELSELKNKLIQTS